MLRPINMRIFFVNFETVKDQLPEYAKDTKLNLSSVLSDAESSGLTLAQIAGIAVASACTTCSKKTIDAITDFAKANLDDVAINAAKAAASLMAMTNVYYRFTHLIEDHDFSKMPAKLRMNFMVNPGVDKNDFELYSLAASAINGCGKCMDAHTNALIKHGVSKEAVQHCIRIAAVINAFSQVLAIESVAE